MPHWRLMTSSDSLRAIDLLGKTWIVTIVRVTQGKYRAGDEQKPGEESQRPKRKGPKLLPDLWFDKFDKPYGSCPTNSAQIEKLTGSDNTEDWVGRTIEIYPTMVDAFGRRKLAIRVSPKLPKEDRGPQRRAPQQPQARGSAPQQPQPPDRTAPPVDDRQPPPPMTDDERREIERQEREQNR